MRLAELNRLKRVVVLLLIGIQRHFVRARGGNAEACGRRARFSAVQSAARLRMRDRLAVGRRSGRRRFAHDESRAHAIDACRRGEQIFAYEQPAVERIVVG